VQKIQKSDACTVVIETYLLKVLPTKKSILYSFILDIFSNFSATKANYKEPKQPKILVGAEESF